MDPRAIKGINTAEVLTIYGAAMSER